MTTDWNLNLPFDTEPTHVPPGDECTHACCGDSCGKTDCPDCGRDALFALTKAAGDGVHGLVAFAREVIRTEGMPDRYTPTLGMLAWLRDIERPATTPAAQFYRRYASRRAFAWAEGVIDAVDKNPWMVSGDFDDQLDEQAAYMVGRLLVELHLVNEHLTKLEAQAMADADITSAAGSLATPGPTAIPTHGRGHAVDSGPGFESRAQHRGHSVR